MARRPQRPADRGQRSQQESEPLTASRASGSARTDSRRWLGGIHLSGFSLMMLALIVLGVMVLAPNLKALVEQRQEIAALQQSVDEQESDLDQLRRERERWNDPSYVKTQARERFFYVSPGEISFIVINDLDETFLPDPTEPISDELTTTDVDWASAMLTSILTSAFTLVDGEDAGTAPYPATTQAPSPTPTDKR